METPEPAACPSCGTPFRGRYCHACGEKRLHDEDRTVRHFVGEALGTFLNLDGTFWRSFGVLIFRPGTLTAAYLRGQRRRYLGPLKIFLLCNLVYFFVQPWTGFSGYSTTLHSHRTNQVYSETLGLDARVRNRLGADTLSVEANAARYKAYEVRFDAKSNTYARTLILLLVPLVALGLKAVLPRHLYADHLVFATHFVAWQLLVVMSAYLMFYAHVLSDPVNALLPEGWAYLLSELSSTLLEIPYLFLALGAAYTLSRGAALWRALVLGMPLLGVLLLATFLYRLLLFWLTFWTTPVPGA